MSDNPSPEFNKFKDFIRRLVSVSKAEIDAIKQDDQKQKKTVPMNCPRR
jgi:hypothetical protein